jgi:hypothetical protein
MVSCFFGNTKIIGNFYSILQGIFSYPLTRIISHNDILCFVFFHVLEFSACKALPQAS